MTALEEKLNLLTSSYQSTLDSLAPLEASKCFGLRDICHAIGEIVIERKLLEELQFYLYSMSNAHGYDKYESSERNCIVMNKFESGELDLEELESDPDDEEESEEDEEDEFEGVEMPESPSAWLFHVVEDTQDPDSRIQVTVTPECYFKKYKAQFDGESSEVLIDLMPEYLEEAMESTWILCDPQAPISVSEVVSDLTKLGFKQSKEFGELFNDL